MLFSSIEDAWRSPKTLESFSNGNNNCNYDCDELIQRLLSCDSCYEKLLQKVNIPTYSKELEYLTTLYSKYIINLNPKMKEKIINILTIIAVVLVVMIMQ
jgi:hypothetical protein